MFAATALVLLMTPALGLFYAGLVRAKNTLNTFMMCLAALAVATVTWTAIGAATAIIVGCVAITPAAGFISPAWAMALGALRRCRATRRSSGGPGRGWTRRSTCSPLTASPA